MAVEVKTRPELPQGVGRFNRSWWVFMAVMLLIAGIGVLAWVREVSAGMASTGLRDIGTMGGATWGLYVSMVVYFIGVSFAGITLAAFIRVFRLRQLQPVARLAEVITVVALILGAIAIIVDLGQPLRGVVNLFRYARPQSPFFGTFTLVIAGYLFASVVYLYLGGRRDAALMAKYPSGLRWYHRAWAAGYQDTPAEIERHRQTSFWLALAIIPLLIAAASTTGFVFGLQVGRPGWYGTLQAPAFLTLAGVSGIGHVVVLAAIMRQVLGSTHRLSTEVFSWLGKALMVLLSIYLYFMVVELLTLLYATADVEKRLSDALLTGEYAWMFWGSVALLVLPLILLIRQALTRRWSIGALVVISALVNIAAIGKRYLIVVPSQTHGTLLPYETGSYNPTLIEYAVVAGLFALGALLIGLFVKTFPALPVSEEEVRTHA